MFDSPKYKLAKQIYYALEEYELIVREQQEYENAKQDEIAAFAEGQNLSLDEVKDLPNIEIDSEAVSAL